MEILIQRQGPRLIILETYIIVSLVLLMTLLTLTDILSDTPQSKGLKSLKQTSKVDINSESTPLIMKTASFKKDSITHSTPFKKKLKKMIYLDFLA